MKLGLDYDALLLASTFVLVVILLWVCYSLPMLLTGLRFGNSRRTPPIKTDNLLEDPPKFSVIVPVKDEEPFIRRCLNAILALDYPSDKMELIIVDGGSKDDTYRICREFSESHAETVKVLQEVSAKGKPSALNLGLSHATGRIVAVFDADSIPEKDVLRKAAAYFTDNEVLALQGKTCSLNRSANVLTRVSALEEAAWFSTLQGREKMRLFIPLTGSCQFIDRQLLDNIGGWDEHYLAEDVELAAKFLEKGYSVKFAPDIVCWQESPSTLGSLFSQRTRWFRGYMEAAIRHGGLLRKPSLKTLDAEVVLSGPFMMTLCLFSYLLWGLSTMVRAVANQSFFNTANIAVALTVLTIASMGLSLVLSTMPSRLRRLAWIPFVYLYWLLQTIIAGWSLLSILLGRPRVWKKTEKAHARGIIGIRPTRDLQRGVP